MTLNIFRKGLWILAGSAVFAYTLLLLATNDRPSLAPEDQSTFSAAFELTDHTGIVRTENDFVGKWLIVFFGFSNCPDVCPTTLAEVANIMKKIGAKSSQVQPLFISVDPERDTPEELAKFVPIFDARIIGLTGTPDQIAKTGKSFYIYYEKIVEASALDEYTVSHSSQLFLFSPSGEYVKAWQYGTPADEILADLKGRI